MSTLNKGKIIIIIIIISSEKLNKWANEVKTVLEAYNSQTNVYKCFLFVIMKNTQNVLLTHLK